MQRYYNINMRSLDICHQYRNLCPNICRLLYLGYNTSMTAIAIIIILGFVVVFANITTPINAHVSRDEVCKKTTLFSFTFPPQMEQNTILCHPVGKALAAANNANIEFNAGIVAAQQHPTTKCPEHTKNACDGWNYQMRWK